MLDELVNVIEDIMEIRNQLINIFLPTRDAIAVALSGVLFLLARNPQVWQRLRVEVLSVKEPLSYDVLKSLRYIKFVLNESTSKKQDCKGNPCLPGHRLSPFDACQS